MKMSKKLKMLAPMVAISLMMTGCGGTKTDVVEDTEVSSNEDVLITLVLDKGGVNDQSFNESAWKGAESASKKYGVEIKYLESTTDSDYIQNIDTAIDMDSDLVIGVGFNLSSAIEEAALNHPEQKFAIVDGSFDEIPTNVTTIMFDEAKAGYLAGLATAKTLTETNKYGFIGGFEIPAVVNYKDGFEKGLKEVNPNAELAVQYANSFSDAAKGKVMAEQLIANGYDCVMTAGGGVNNGVYEACKEKGKYAVAVDMAQSYIAPEVIVSSAIKKVDVGVEETIKSLIDGKLVGGISVSYEQSVGYEKTSLMSDEAITFVDSLNK